MCINGHLFTFSEPIKVNQKETFNGRVYVEMFESGGISLYDYIMHFYVHLTEKNEMVNYKMSLVILITVFYHY